jgi:hypothetical protein
MTGGYEKMSVAMAKERGNLSMELPVH